METKSKGEREIKRLPETFGIRFGLLNPKIAKQIKEQGLKYDVNECYKFERMRNAIYELWLTGLLIQTQFDKLLIKLYKKNPSPRWKRKWLRC